MATALSKLMVELGLDDQLSGPLGKVGGNLKKVLGVAAIAGAAAGIGVALFKVGSAADDMADTITVKTGASGKAFEALQKTSLDVFKSIPTDMHTAAVAVSELSVKTGATGKNLDSLAKSEIELARITGTDLSGNIDASAKLFNIFGVAAGDQVSTLDALFNISQKTGVGIDQLMAETQQFAPVLKALGLGADASANLIGKLDKAGLHTSVVMQGFKKSIGVFAKQGISDVHAGLTQVFTDIKGAGTAADGTAIAMKYFGAKAGPELAQAIRDGTLSVDDLNAILGDTGDSILDTAAKTNDFSENFKIFKNNVEAALIPLGSFIFGGLNLLIPLLTAGVQGLGDFIGQLKPFGLAMQAAFDRGVGIKNLVEFLPPGLANLEQGFLKVADAAGDLVHAFQSGGFSGLIDALPGEIQQAVSGIGSIAINATIDIASWTLGKVSDLWGWLQGLFGAGTPTGDGTGGPDTDKVVTLSDVLVNVGSWVLGKIVDLGKWLAGAIKQTWNGIVDIGTATIQAVVGLAGDLKSIADDAASWITTNLHIGGGQAIDIGRVDLYGDVTIHNTGGEADPGKSFVQKFLDGIYATGKAIHDAGIWMATNAIQGLGFGIGAVAGAIVTAVGAIVYGLVVAITSPSSILAVDHAFSTLVSEGVRATLSQLAEFFTLFWSSVAAGFGAAIPDSAANAVQLALARVVMGGISLFMSSTAWPALLVIVGVELVQGLLDGLESKWNDFANWFMAIPGQAGAYIGDVTATLLPQGVALIQGLLDGAAQQWEAVNAWLGDRGEVAVSAVGDLGAMLYAAGSQLIEGLWQGAGDEWDNVTGWLGGLGSEAARFVGNLSGALYQEGYNLIWGMAQGIYDGAGIVSGAVQSIVNSIPPAIRSMLGISSPSKVMADLLYAVPQGMAQGMMAGQGLVANAARSLGAGIPGSIANWNTPGSLSLSAYGGNGGSGGGTTNTWGGITINVMGNADPKATADEVFAVFNRELNLRHAS